SADRLLPILGGRIGISKTIRAHGDIRARQLERIRLRSGWRRVELRVVNLDRAANQIVDCGLEHLLPARVRRDELVVAERPLSAAAEQKVLVSVRAVFQIGAKELSPAQHRNPFGERGTISERGLFEFARVDVAIRTRQEAMVMANRGFRPRPLRELEPGRWWSG